MTDHACLTLEETIAVRYWIYAARLEQDEQPPTRGELTALRTRLALKAHRLGQPWAFFWLAPRQCTQTFEHTALQRLDFLQQSPDRAPSHADPIDYWLPPAIHSALPKSWCTMQSLITHRQQEGRTAWRRLPGIGPHKATVIEQVLNNHFAAALLPLPPAPVELETAVVPLERFLCPPGLDGSTGLNRTDSLTLLGINNDIDALNSWLNRMKNNNHTFRAYRKEAERFYLWSILKSQVPLSSTTPDHFIDYYHFLMNPTPTKEWIGPSKPRSHSNWKPFVGPLSPRSAQHAITIVSGLCQWLVDVRYLSINPWRASGPLPASPNEVRSPVRQRTFTIYEWRQLKTYLTEQRQQSPNDDFFARAQLIIYWLYGTALRLNELSRATLGDIQIQHKEGKTHVWLIVTNKGQKHRTLPLPKPLLTCLESAYQTLYQRSWQRFPHTHGVIPKQRVNETAILTPAALHHQIKQLLQRWADTLASKDPDLAAKARKASAHWLRHTHASHAVHAPNPIPLPLIRDNLGHANIVTTSQYLQTDDDLRHSLLTEWLENDVN